MPEYLIEPRFVEPYKAWKTSPGLKETGTLLRALEPVIDEAIRSYGGQSIGSPTLKGKAKSLTLKNLPKYDPSKASMRTFLGSNLQILRRYGMREAQSAYIPDQAYYDVQRMKLSENLLQGELARDPSDAELADHSGLSLRRLAHIRGIQPAISEGSITNKAFGQGESASLPMIGVKQRPSQGAIDAWQEAVYLDLDPHDQVIMEHSLGMRGKRVISNQEIAAKLRMSPSTVSQRKMFIQKKLDIGEETHLL